MALPFAPPVVPFGGPPPTDTDPGVNTSDQAVRNAWNALAPDRFSALCNAGYATGDYSYLATVLRVSRSQLIMLNFMETRFLFLL